MIAVEIGHEEAGPAHEWLDESQFARSPFSAWTGTSAEMAFQQAPSSWASGPAKRRIEVEILERMEVNTLLMSVMPAQLRH